MSASSFGKGKKSPQGALPWEKTPAPAQLPGSLPMSATFAELLSAELEGCNKDLDISLGEFEWSVRARRALSIVGIASVRALLGSRYGELKKRKNVGARTLEELLTTLHTYLTVGGVDTRGGRPADPARADTPPPQDTAESILDSLLALFDGKSASCFKARYGYDDGTHRNYEEIAGTLGLTRERVRQIQEKNKERLLHRAQQRLIEPLLKSLDSVLHDHQGIAGPEDLTAASFFEKVPLAHAAFLMRLLGELFESKYRLLCRRRFITTLADEALGEMGDRIRDSLHGCTLPATPERLAEKISRSLNETSQAYVRYILFEEDEVPIEEGVVPPHALLPAGMAERARTHLAEIESGPLHYSAIAALYEKAFLPAGQKMTPRHVRNLYASLLRSKDFILVGVGTFMLRERFPVPENFNEIVRESRRILRQNGSLTDTKWLIERLRERGVPLGELNSYSLKELLAELPGFTGFRKFEIVASENTPPEGRKSMIALIFEFIAKQERPVTLKMIRDGLALQKSNPPQTISQCINGHPEIFIKVQKSVYCLPKHIEGYDEKRARVLTFVKKWVTREVQSISTALVTEAFKAREAAGALPAGFVEHVLAGSPDFAMVRRGCYVLAESGLPPEEKPNEA